MNEPGKTSASAGADGPQTAEALLPELYLELRKLPAAKMAREAPGNTLQATALVHEAWLRLDVESRPLWQNRAHFFGAAAEAMRRILIERARSRRAQRHGGGAEHVSLEAFELSAGMDDEQILALHDALERLAARSPEQAELVKLKFFAGVTLEEAASFLGVSEPTARRYWSYARAWLYREMERDLHRT
jgi:RNA polymerase sigma factor (TIGR02999 family)